MNGVKMFMIEKLYEKYMLERSNTPVFDNVALYVDTFEEVDGSSIGRWWNGFLS